MDKPWKITESFNPHHHRHSNIQWLGDGSRWSGVVQKKRNTTAPEDTRDSRIRRQVFHNGPSWDLARGSLDVSAPVLRQLPLTHSMLVLALLGSIPKLISIPSFILVSPCRSKDELLHLLQQLVLWVYTELEVSIWSGNTFKLLPSFCSCSHEPCA